MKEKKPILIIYDDFTFEYKSPESDKTIKGKINPAAFLGITLLGALGSLKYTLEKKMTK